MLAHEAVGDEYQPVPRKHLADSHVVAAGNADVTLGLDLGAGVDVAHDRGPRIPPPQVAHVLSGYSVAE